MVPYVMWPEKPVPFGMDRDIMLSLASKLNLKMKFIYAKKIPHIVTKIVRDEADMSISHPSFLYGFYKMGVDVSPTLRTKSFIFAISHDKAIESYATVVLSPFTDGVWASTIVSLIGVIIVIGMFNRYQLDNSLHSPKVNFVLFDYRFYKLKFFVGFSDISVVLVPLLNSNIPKTWYKITKRWAPYSIIIAFWMFVGLFLSNAYKSTLLASLIKRDVEKSPDTFQVTFQKYYTWYFVLHF